MSILVDKTTRVLVQGITGRDGSFHARGMLEYGTRIVAGVTPGKGGTRFDDRVPVYDTVAEAVAETQATTSVIYVPAPFAADAVLEAAAAGLELVVCITEGIPVADMLEVAEILGQAGGRTRLLGPNCPGVISPGQTKVGIMPGFIHKPGRVGLVSRSGTLTYEVVKALSDAAIGQSTCIGIGGDPIIGTTFVDVLELFADDTATDAVVLIGEIGGTDEQEAADSIRSHAYPKPVVAFIAGQTAPPGRRMGHAGAIVAGSSGTAEEKMRAFQEVGVAVARVPSEIPALLGERIASRAR